MTKGRLYLTRNHQRELLFKKRHRGGEKKLFHLHQREKRGGDYERIAPSVEKHPKKGIRFPCNPWCET